MSENSYNTASFEFLEFIADISHPGTGQILPERLASWLGVATVELERDYLASSAAEWTEFADGVLSVLDALQDRTGSLEVTMLLYKSGLIDAPCPTKIRNAVVLGRATLINRRIRTGCEILVSK